MTDHAPEARAEQELNAIMAVAQRLIEEALAPGIDLDRFLAHVMDQTLGLVAFDFGWLLLREGDRVRIARPTRRTRPTWAQPSPSRSASADWPCCAVRSSTSPT